MSIYDGLKIFCDAIKNRKYKCDNFTNDALYIFTGVMTGTLSYEAFEAFYNINIDKFDSITSNEYSFSSIVKDSFLFLILRNPDDYTLYESTLQRLNILSMDIVHNGNIPDRNYTNVEEKS